MVYNNGRYRLQGDDRHKVAVHASGENNNYCKSESPFIFTHRKESLFIKFRQSLSRMSVYAGRISKPANAYLRWNLLFTIIIIFFITFPFWIPLIPTIKNISLDLILGVLMMLNIFWLIAMINVVRYTIKLRKFKNHKIDLKKVNPSGKVIKHLVGICIYKEPLNLIMETLDSVAHQSNSKEKISVVVGLEDGTPEKDEKARSLRQRYGPLFEMFMVTIHPKGKCSNLNYAMREAVSILKKTKGYCNSLDPPEVLVTTGDCDSIFGERYFDALEEDYCLLNEKKRMATVWQSPLFYHMGKKNTPFFVRVTGILRSFFMMGYLIPFNINTMSIFSLTLDLLERGEFTHPGYQMEDIIAVIRWSLAINKKCTIRCIPVATLSGPTSGKTYYEELYEWARQIRRWTIGAAEVFHYFVIKSTSLPIGASLSFACIFIFYYGFVLCVSTLFSFIAPIAVTSMLKIVGHPVSGYFIKSEKEFNFIVLGLFCLQYIWFFFVFFLHGLAEKIFPSGGKDRTGTLYNILHYLLSCPTMFMYSCVEIFAFFEVTIRGKYVCSHNPSKKNNLLTKVDNNIFII